MRRLTLAAPLLVLPLLIGCSATPLGEAHALPDDVPDPADVRIVRGHGFRLFLDQGCLTSEETDGLLDELKTARKRLLAFLGPARAPGNFRPYGVARAQCPAPTDAPAALPNPIDVVVVRKAKGGRCHADGGGLCVIKSHIPRRDATHELVHFLAGSAWRPIDEGLAVYLTEKIWGPAKGFPVKIRARVFLDLGLNSNLYPNEVKQGMSRRDYDTAGAFVGWLLEAYGPEQFWKLYAGAVRNYHPVYDTSEVELWERFWRYIGNLDVRHNGNYYAYKALLTGG